MNGVRSGAERETKRPVTAPSLVDVAAATDTRGRQALRIHEAVHRRINTNSAHVLKSLGSSLWYVVRNDLRSDDPVLGLYRKCNAKWLAGRFYRNAFRCFCIPLHCKLQKLFTGFDIGVSFFCIYSRPVEPSFHESKV